MNIAYDQFVLCKAAIVFALTRWLLSFALNLISNYTLASTSCRRSSASGRSSSANLRSVTDNLTITTLENIQQRLPENHDLSCAVCLNELREKSQVFELRNCCHVFHKQCLEKWISYDDRLTCPLCRVSLITAASPPPEQPSWAVERMLYLFGDDLLP